MMKPFAIVCTAVFLSLSVFTNAQSDTAHHRAVFSEINAKESSLKKVTGTHKDEPTEYALTAWLDGNEVRKIVAKCSDDGAGVEEYYLEKEKPLFVFSTYSKGSEGAKAAPRVEERLYFKDGRVFKWLTNEKSAPVLHGEDYDGMTERLTTNCTAFLAALKQGKPVGNAMPAAKITEGTFTGIEEGDYFHWNMKTKAGEEMSFFILKPDQTVDKVLDKPKAFVGKNCRVTWKKSTENIPEAGGKMEIDQILSVEWLGK